VDMHATDLVGINRITRVLSVYTCQQGVYRRSQVLLIPTSLRQLSAEISSCEIGETWREMVAEFCRRNISFILAGFFNMP
jgi:hypothetical protein